MSAEAAVSAVESSTGTVQDPSSAEAVAGVGATEAQAVRAAGAAGGDGVVTHSQALEAYFAFFGEEGGVSGAVMSEGEADTEL